jgi:o-succinylbenzoate synthase
MRITGARIDAYRLPLCRTWRTANGAITERRGWLVALETEDGRTGWGDCAPLPAPGIEASESAEAALRSLLSWLKDLSPREALTRLEQEASCTPAARFALETALVDLAAQAERLPMARWFNSRAVLSVAVNATLGAIDEDLAERANAALAAGYRVLKIKIGIGPWETEKKLLRELVDALPDGVRLRLDANRAWSEHAAQAALKDLADLPVESVEEPLEDADPIALAKLQHSVPFALTLDESLADFNLESLPSACPVRRLVLKPTVLGGLGRTLAAAEKAREAGLECVVTSALESSVGVRAAAHLAAALGGSLVHGLATSSWLAQDVAVAPRIENGRIELENRPGLGVCFG